MGLLLSVLVGCVGAVELVSCLHYISDEWLLHQLRTQNKDAIEAALNKYQEEIKGTITQLEKNRIDGEDDFVDGYRIDNSEINEELRLKFEERLKEIIKQANIENGIEESDDSDEPNEESCSSEQLSQIENIPSKERIDSSEFKIGNGEACGSGMQSIKIEKIKNDLESENVISTNSNQLKVANGSACGSDAEISKTVHLSEVNSSLIKSDNILSTEESDNSSEFENIESDLELLKNQNDSDKTQKPNEFNIDEGTDNYSSNESKLEADYISDVPKELDVTPLEADHFEEELSASEKLIKTESVLIDAEEAINEYEISQKITKTTETTETTTNNENERTTEICQKKEINQNGFPNFNTDPDKENMINDNLMNELIEKQLQDELLNEPLNSDQTTFISKESTSDDTTQNFPDIHFEEYDRPSQYSDDYLRTLDGVKSKPLVRDDGSGRRRAFKKRNSSSSSSRDSKASREEELKLFTSLEEAEFESMKTEYVPIQYSSEPNLKVKKHHRRHKKNSVPDMERTIEKEEDGEEDEEHSSISYDMVDEVGGEEVTHPWGDIKPELRRDSDYFRRMGKESSIDEVDEIDEIEQSERQIREHFSKFKIAQENEDAKSMKSTYYENDQNLDVTDLIENAVLTTERSKTPVIPRTDSFEEASNSQHEKVIDILKKRGVNDTEEFIKNETENLTGNNTHERFIWGVTPKKDINVSNNDCDTIGLNAFINAEKSNTSLIATNKEIEINEFSTRLQKIEKEIDQKICDWMGQGDGDSHELPITKDNNFTINDLMSHDEFLQDFSMIESEKEQFVHEIKEIDDHDEKIDEFTKYIKNLDQKDAINIDDEYTNVKDINIYESDEEPNYGNDPNKILKQQMSVIVEENLDKGTEDLFTLDSDEEPMFEAMYEKIIDDLDLDENDEGNRIISSDALDADVELKSDIEKRNKVRKHKKSSGLRGSMSESEDDSISGKETTSRKVHSRQRRRGKFGFDRSHDPNDMKDHHDDIIDDFTHLKIIGNEKDFILDSDEEPYLRELFMVDPKEMETLSGSSSNEYLLLQKMSSDEEPNRHNKPKNVKSTGAIPKTSTQTFTEKLIDFDRKYLSEITEEDRQPAHLGLVREYTLDSDEEPYYKENRIIYDDGDSNDEDYVSYLHRIYCERHSDDEICNRDFCHCRMFVERERRVREEREYDEIRRLRLYDEYDIEQNEHYSLFPVIGTEKMYTGDSDEEPNFVHREVYKCERKNRKSEERNRKSEDKYRKSEDIYRKSEERTLKTNFNEGPDSFLTAIARPDHYGIDYEVGMSSRSLLDLEKAIEEEDKNVMFRSSLILSPGVLNLGDSDEYSNEDDPYSSRMRKSRTIIKKFVLPTQKSDSDQSDTDPFGFGKVTKRKLLDLEEDFDDNDSVNNEEGAVGQSSSTTETNIKEETIITSYKITETSNFSKWESETTTTSDYKNNNFGKSSIFQIKDEPENDEEHMWESEPEEESQISVVDRTRLGDTTFDWDDDKDELEDETVPNGNESPAIDEESGTYTRFDNADDDWNETTLSNTRFNNNVLQTIRNDKSEMTSKKSENDLDWLDVNEMNLRRTYSCGNELVGRDEDNSESFNWDTEVQDEIFPDNENRRPSVTFSRIPKVYEKMEELQDLHDNKDKIPKRREGDFDWKDESPFRIVPSTDIKPEYDYGNSLEATTSGSSGTIKKQPSNQIPLEEERELFESILNRKKREISKQSSLEDSEVEDDNSVTTGNQQKNLKSSKKNKNKKKKKKGTKEKEQEEKNSPQTDPNYLLKESMYPFY